MQFDCFLTHDWGTDELDRNNHARVSQVCVRLKDAGFKPWFDEEFMRGDLNKTMTDALSRSRCVIVFITNRYVEKASGNGEHGANDNCKFEFDTALMPPLGVDKMISVVMEPSCRSPGNWPNGTVRGKLGLKLYVDLADDGAGFDRGIERLIAELRATISEAPSSSGGHLQPSAGAPGMRKLKKQSSFEKLKNMVVGGSTKQVDVTDGTKPRAAEGHSFFLSHTQRDAEAKLMVSDVYYEMEKLKKSCWLDVKMTHCDEAAMRKGVEESACFLAFITDNGEDSYFSREMCRKELRWAIDAKLPIVPVITVLDKPKVNDYIAEGQSHGIDLSNHNFCHVDRSGPEYLQASLKVIIAQAARAPPATPSPANRKLKKQSSFERLRGLLPGGARKHAVEGAEACAWLSLEQQDGGDGRGSLALTVHDEGSDVLRYAASRAVNLVSVCGRLGTGKSYLMNALAQQPNAFGVSSGAKSFTMGAHLGPALMEFGAFSGRPSPPTSPLLGFVDMEGQVAAYTHPKPLLP